MEKGKSKMKSANGNVRFRRQNFSSQETFLLLQLLKEVQVKRTDQSGNFSPDDWKVIHPRYNERCSATTRSEDELRSRYKTVKKNFYIYKELTDKSGWVWNYIVNLPLAPSAASWSELIKTNKKYKGYQRRAFPWFKEMEELCGKNVASGANNVTSNSNSERADEELDGFHLNSTRRQEFDQNGNNCDSIGNNQPVYIPVGRIEPSIGNQSQTEPRATSSSRKRRAEATEGESSENKWKHSNGMEHLLRKVIEQNDRMLEQQDVRNGLFSQWVASRPNRPDPNEVCREIMSKLNSNGINLGPNELTALVVTLANPWIRAVFLNIEDSQLRDWITNLLAPSNLITRRMMTMDMDRDFLFRPSEDEKCFTAAMMNDDRVYIQIRNTNMMMLSLMSSLSHCLRQKKPQKKSRKE